MLSFKVYNRIHSVKKIWQQLIPEDSRNIYQTYSFNRILYSHYIQSGFNFIGRIRFGNKPIFVVEYKDGVGVCIAPLFLFNNPTKVIRILGYSTNAGYLDFIYQNEQYVTSIVQFLKQQFPDHCFEFTFVSAHSPLCREGNILKEFGNYAIFIENYDSWYTNLSKNTKQNIRTAYNRLKTDGHTVNLCIYNMKSPILEKIILSANDIYWRRKMDWTGNKAVYSKYNREVFPKKDVIYQSLRKKENTIIAILRINNQESGFFVGFKYDHGICIPRLAIDMQYARYSPGILLINEYLKSLPETEYPYIYDLCRGDEGYKSMLHGERTSTYKILIQN